MNARRALWCLTLMTLLCGSRLSAQQPPAPPPDPLGRETPRGSVLGFIGNARNGKFDIAAQYLEAGPRNESATELAGKLYTILNGRMPVRIGSLSDKPDGSVANPLTPDREVVGTIPSASGELSIVLTRITSRNGPRIWVFSRSTLQWVPDVYSEVNLRSIDRYLPSSLTFRLGRVRLFHWLILFGIVPLIYRLMGGLDSAIRWLLIRWRGADSPAAKTAAYVPGSVRLLLMAFVIYLFVPSIDLPLAERGLWALVVAAFTIVGGIGLALLTVDFGAVYLQERAHERHYGERRALIRLLRDVAKGLVFALGGVVTLRYFGFDPTAALAGLGIGGIAIALAAQKTLENVIGGFSVVFDKAIRVGDFLKVGETSGTVDYVGLRSTRIRTMDRTIVTVPNGQMATVNIETLSVRDKFWFRHVVGLSYGTTVEQMRAVSAAFEDLLARHPAVDTASVRVRFFRMGPYSLDVELFAYVFATDWDRFLAVQQELLLRVMESVAAVGTEIAFPSQTLHVADGRPRLSEAERPPSPATSFQR